MCRRTEGYEPGQNRGIILSAFDSKLIIEKASPMGWPSDCRKSVFHQNIPIKNVGAIIDRPLVRRENSGKSSAKARYFFCFNTIKICNISGAQ